MDKDDNKNEQNNKKKKKNALLYLIIILLIFLIFVVIKNGKKEESRLERDINALQGVLPGKTSEEIQRLLNEVVEEGMVNISINPDPVFENGKSEGNICIENIPGNHYLLQVDISLVDTGEVVFSSGLLDPGYYIQNIKLDKNLSKGDYPAIATFTAYYPDDFNDVLAKVNAEIVLHILN